MTKRVRFYSIDFPGYRGVIKESFYSIQDTQCTYKFLRNYLYTVSSKRGKHTITQHNYWDYERGPLDAGNFIYWRVERGPVRSYPGSLLKVILEVHRTNRGSNYLRWGAP